MRNTNPDRILLLPKSIIICLSLTCQSELICHIWTWTTAHSIWAIVKPKCKSYVTNPKSQGKRERELAWRGDCWPPGSRLPTTITNFNSRQKVSSTECHIYFAPTICQCPNTRPRPLGRPPVSDFWHQKRHCNQVSIDQSESGLGFPKAIRNWDRLD